LSQSLGWPKRGLLVSWYLRGQWIIRAPGQDKALRHLERRETCMEVVEPAPDHGRFNATGLGAEALMVPGVKSMFESVGKWQA
jgi:hypothetical protein